MSINMWQWLDADGVPHLGVSDGPDMGAVVDVTRSLNRELDTIDAAWREAGSVDGLVAMAKRWLSTHVSRQAIENQDLQVPVPLTECWAAGVTYEVSRTARIEETHGGQSFYRQVYDAERPELFFKAPGNRVVGTGSVMGLRPDASWHVPEPELTVILAPDGSVVGYTIGNDLSSRDIEGENPLYLPQAKIFHRSAAIGPSLALAPTVDPLGLTITLTIFRGGESVYRSSIQTAQMRRSIETLVRFLRRAWPLDRWTALMTGTALVPPSDITLQTGDVVAIDITDIGRLTNPVRTIGPDWAGL